MTNTLSLKKLRSFSFKSFYEYLKSLGLLKLMIAGLFFFILIFTNDLRNITLQTMADGYIQVSCFVAATLAVFYALEYYFKIDTKSLLKKYKLYQVPIAALLGALPGCGGAILVVTQYVRGRISFGAVVAVLTATMGDAAFLLLAQAPLTAMMVFSIGLVVGIITGYVVDTLHGQNFLRPPEQEDKIEEHVETHHEIHTLNILWVLMIIPGFILAVLSAFQVLPQNEIITLFGSFSASLCIFMAWYIPRREADTSACSPTINQTYATQGQVSGENDPTYLRVIHDTNFVTTWVIAAFLAYEYFMYFSGFDLQLLFAGWALLLPLIAVLIGFIPGCGPQVIVTSLYLQGIIPLSAQLGNAISNDGDALFPALALAPKASVIATLYSAIPAVIVAYGWMFLFEI